MKNKKYPNLTPWQPGQSGNPSGRKPGSKNMTTIVQELLDSEVSAELLNKSGFTEMVNGESTTYAKAVVLATIYKALQGNMQAIIWLAEQQERETAEQQRVTREPIIVSTIKPRHFTVD